MALGQALLTKPSKPKPPQQQQQEQETKKLGNAVVQEQTLKFEQSLELVRTLLGASIGCLSFLRGLLPEECFVEKRYGGKSSAAMSYRSFTSDIDDESFKKTAAGSGTRVKRLRRGYSGEADQLLDWLEVGIFDALQKGYLKAVQLAIYVDKEHPEVIIESYTFSFSYREKEDGTSTISLRVTDLSGRGVTVEDANKNLQLMMRRLIVITQNLPPLPDQRWLTIRLHYLDHTPSDYDPPTFVRVSADSTPLQFHADDVNEIERLEVGSLNAGFHAISLKISSMNNTESQERSKRRRGPKTIHADMDIETPPFVTDPPVTASKGHQNITGISESLEAPVSSTRQEKGFNLLLGARKPQGSGSLKSIKGTSAHLHQPPKRAGRNTQEKILLRGMLRPAVQEDGIIETQPLSDPGVSDKQDSPFNTELPPTSLGGAQTSDRTQTLVPISAGHTSTPLELIYAGTEKPPASLTNRVLLGEPASATSAHHQSVRPQKVCNLEPASRTPGTTRLSNAKIIELKLKEKIKDVSGSPRRGRTIDGDDLKGGKHQGRINCECGDEKPEGSIICCDNCDEWQHTDCYGFTSAKDTRIPDYHVCYSCLLGANEGKLLEEMRNMALFRRALKVIWSADVFPSSNKIFANRLGCDLPTALQITKRLETEGFIAHDVVKSKIWRKRAYAVLKTNETKSLMDSEYFDPLKKVSHHFENPEPVDTIRESLLEERTLEEPFPGTTHKNDTQAVNHDMESTTDEEENVPVLKNARKDVIHRDSATDRVRISGHSKVKAGAAYNALKPSKRPPIEIAESPEPMEIDTMSNLQVLIDADGNSSKATNHRVNVGGTLHDIFVGEELSQKDF